MNDAWNILQRETEKQSLHIAELLYFCRIYRPLYDGSAVWTIADIFNGLMAIPNMIAMFALSGVVVKETKSFFKAQKHKRD